MLQLAASTIVFVGSVQCCFTSIASSRVCASLAMIQHWNISSSANVVYLNWYWAAFRHCIQTVPCYQHWNINHSAVIVYLNLYWAAFKHCRLCHASSRVCVYLQLVLFIWTGTRQLSDSVCRLCHRILVPEFVCMYSHCCLFKLVLGSFQTLYADCAMLVAEFVCMYSWYCLFELVLGSFQTLYADCATPVGESGSRMAGRSEQPKTPQRLEPSICSVGATLAEETLTPTQLRQIPKWMLGTRGSSSGSASMKATLEKSSSNSSVEKGGG